jgi:hypothetical protein
MVFEPLSAEPLNCTPWSPCGRLGLKTTTACKLSSPDPTTEPLICTPWSPCRKSGSKTPAALRLGFSEWSWQQSHWIALPGANVEDRAGELPLLSDLVLLSQQRRHWTALPEAHAGYWAWEPHCSQTLFCQDAPEAELNRAPGSLCRKSGPRASTTQKLGAPHAYSTTTLPSWSSFLESRPQFSCCLNAWFPHTCSSCVAPGSPCPNTSIPPRATAALW